MTKLGDQVSWPHIHGGGVRNTKWDPKSRALNPCLRHTSMHFWGYHFVAVLLKNNFNKSGFKILRNWTLYDLLK